MLLFSLLSLAEWELYVCVWWEVRGDTRECKVVKAWLLRSGKVELIISFLDGSAGSLFGEILVGAWL